MMQLPEARVAWPDKNIQLHCTMTTTVTRPREEKAQGRQPNGGFWRPPQHTGAARSLARADGRPAQRPVPWQKPRPFTPNQRLAACKSRSSAQARSSIRRRGAGRPKRQEEREKRRRRRVRVLPSLRHLPDICLSSEHLFFFFSFFSPLWLNASLKYPVRRGGRWALVPGARRPRGRGARRGERARGAAAAPGQSKHGLLQQRNTNRVGVVSEKNQAPAAAQRNPFSYGRDTEGNSRTQAIFRRPTTRTE